MTDKTEKPEKVLILQVRPGREELVGSCYESLGYRLEKVKREEHADTQMIFVLEDPASADLAKMQQCRSVLGKLEAIDKRVTYYYLQLVCLVGLIGAVCLGLSFVALRVGQHTLFTILLILGIFGCTITLYLRPLFTGMGMRKYGGEEPALVADLQSLLGHKDGARPWILFAAPLMFVCMILLFIVPKGNDNLTAIWIFISYTVFYAIAYTMYSTAHTLMVPLATRNDEERRGLSTIANTPGMAAGSLVAILFPCIIVPLLGVSESLWVMAAIIIAVFSFPLMLLEFSFTRERVNTTAVEPKKVSLLEQLRCCVKSRSWVMLMVYLIVLNLVNQLFSTATFYYCNWVLGSYNDGYTQALFYALGQAPLGIGVLLCNPICKKFGKRNALLGGMVVSVIGVALCLLNPRSLAFVLAGQFIRTVGLIPSTYMVSSLLGDALDDVERVSGERCDGFSSSVFNCIITISGGIALCAFNFGISHLGYQAPTADLIPVQNDTLQNFLIFCVIGIQLIAYPVIGVLTRFFPKDKEA